MSEQEQGEQPRALRSDEKRIVDETQELLDAHRQKAQEADHAYKYQFDRIGYRAEQASERFVEEARKKVELINVEESQPHELEPHQQKLVYSTQQDHADEVRAQKYIEYNQKLLAGDRLDDQALSMVIRRDSIWRLLPRKMQEAHARSKMAKDITEFEAKKGMSSERARQKAEEINPPAGE